MTLRTLLEGLGYTGYTGDEEIKFITDDSRKVSEGCLFVCIKGAKFDGHSAAAEVLEKGAVAVVAERDLGIEKQILCENTRSAYSLLCSAFFGNPADRLEMVGVTGTNGKTTTCFVLKEIFDTNGFKTGLLGTVKNMVADKEYPATLTTPDPYELFSLLAEMVEAGCRYCFMEVSSQALSQRRVDPIHFSAAVFTNLTQDHLDYHGTFENYKAAKKTLFSKTDVAIVNYDDDESQYILEGLDCRRITYSAKSDLSSYSAKNIHLRSDCVEYELVSDSLIGRVHFGVPGRFSVYNSMAAAVCAVELGIDLDSVLSSLSECGGVKGRMEVVKTDTDYTVIIDYAHSPDGLLNVLTSLRETVEGRIICMFGCGGDRDRTKRPIMGKIVSENADITVVTSDNPRTEDPVAIIDDILAGITSGRRYVEPDRKKATALALSKAKAGDVVVLAGKGHEDYQILGTEKIHYDEREIVRDILNIK
ncbi:MAG: UDP-N-acetylmuramoyl-L-alanyl-D-glutamate--2,6-diaminopimelate ligase [Clostridia bacterium]|nr:UDP-N-acetylmuramoyl-L-alanyl-D-glutamate--2,6-diaminopimelate ligase [Clostridia bacterium]